MFPSRYFSGSYFAPRYFTGALARTLAWTGRPLILVTSYLDTGTKYSSDMTVRHPSHTYDPEVLSWSNISRSLAIPPGPPIVGSMELDLADSPNPTTGVQYWRETLHTTTQRRRKVEIRLAEEGAPESLASVPYVGELQSATFPPDRVRIQAGDIWSRWLDRQIPPLGTRENFPNMPEDVDGFFAPRVFGTLLSVDPSQLGVIPAILCNTVTNDYIFNADASQALSDVYRKSPGEDFFTVVDPMEYAMYPDLPARTIDGLDYIFTYVRFFVAQPDGTEIRVDVQGGYNTRMPFGVMPPESAGLLRNPVDIAIDILAMMAPHGGGLAHYNGLLPDLCDTQSFQDVWQYYEDNALPFDGAILEPMDFRSAMTQLLSNAQFHIYQNNNGLMAARLNVVTDPGRPVFTEKSDILRFVRLGDSESEVDITPSQPEETINTFNYSYAKNFSTGNFAYHESYVNAADLAELGIVEDLSVELNWTRDAASALWAIEQWAAYTTLRSYRCELSVKMVDNVEKIDLGNQIGLTYYGGMGGHWINKEFIIYGIESVLSELRYVVRAIHREFPGAIL